ncbi:MAG: hypothetical protein KME08_19750 [Aphanothece sp. CMT-3BRIN-NPC111]|jgi:predicted O-linked N-acetylglucosamine transferase (SPINDLY family)|nr:hypothetical protein [Aphanothece sp. CMT-3BRIN-NPC111]
MTNINDIQVNPRELLALYLNQEYDQLSESLIRLLEHFENVAYFQLNSEGQYFVNAFVKNFLYLFTQPDYLLSDNHAIQFIRFNATISNLVAMSSFKTTDRYLEILRSQPHNFLKVLALYSARNTVYLDRKKLFDTHREYTSIWYSHFYELYFSGFVNERVNEHFKEHLYYGAAEKRLTNFYNVSNVYFAVTYADGDRDREIKQKINRSVQEGAIGKTIQIKNTPHPKKIAIVTGLWFPAHSVYRTLFHFVESLKDDYELTLINLNLIRNDIDFQHFKEVINVDVKDIFSNQINSIQKNEFMVSYYPDVGMTDASIFLANLRIAPIQVCTVGHSVSTFGSEIDYFISGADVEVSDNAQANYSERLVLLPGLGIINNPPLYQPQHLQKDRPEFIINCPWTCYKANYQLIQTLDKIVKASPKKILLRFFTGGSESRKNSFLPFAKDLELILNKDCFEVVPAQPYEQYMALLELGDICIDSYHFGGCNTVADVLYLGKPIVTFEGNKWYNRIGSQMLRMVGLSELIATNEGEYLHLILKLIENDEYRFGIQEKIRQADLSNTIFNSESKKYFKKAIDFLVKNDRKIKDKDWKKPILIR